jgi:hypothetical protein
VSTGQGRRAGAGTAKSRRPKGGDTREEKDARGVNIGANTFPARANVDAMPALDANPEPSSLDRLASLFGGGGVVDNPGQRADASAASAPSNESLEQFPLALKESWRCRCWDRRLETGERANPYTYGHSVHCEWFIALCPRCGGSSGTHGWKCPFWNEHPDQSPF